MTSLGRARKQARNHNRRVLREHRTRDVFLHSTKVTDLGEGAAIWGFFGCPRCGGVFDDLSGATAQQIDQID